MKAFYLELIAGLLPNSALNSNVASSTTQSQEFYHTVANDLYDDTGAKPEDHDYSRCGPAEPADDENYTYIQTKQLVESESSSCVALNTPVT